MAGHHALNRRVTLRIMKLLPLVLLAAMAAFAQKVTVEFDQAAAFGKYKTFAIRMGDAAKLERKLDDMVRKSIEKYPPKK